jgi:hypothetical protein
MAALINSRIMRMVPILIVVCLAGVAAPAETSTYVFVPEQSTVVQTGGIAYVHRTYSIKGHFQLKVDPGAGTASFAHVDANATDDSPFKRTLDLNHVFNMTSLVGTVEPSGSIKFTGKAPDDSDVGITVTLQDRSAHLIGQTTPPPHSADFFIFSLDAVAQLRKYSGGSGTADDPYQITTAADIIALGETPEDYDKHFILVDDIDLDPNLPDGKVLDMAVIAPGWETPYNGVFDGNGHAISNLTIKGTDYLGLFGILGSEAEVRDLGVVNVNITGSGDGIGGVVGVNESSVVNCYSTGSVNGSGFVGGLVGSNLDGHVKTCFANSIVTGTMCVGGLAGYNACGGFGCGPDSGITNCYVTGTVAGSESVGGLVGVNGCRSDFTPCIGLVTNCHSASGVSGIINTGGLVGSNSGTVTHCYSRGSVGGSERIGGLVGSNTDPWGGEGVVTACFWDTQTSGQATSAGGTGKTIAEMQTAKTFLDAGWDFVNVWGIGENQTYPYLRKYSAADINQDASVNLLDLAALAENWLKTR